MTLVTVYFPVCEFEGLLRMAIRAQAAPNEITIWGPITGRYYTLHLRLETWCVLTLELTLDGRPLWLASVEIYLGKFLMRPNLEELFADLMAVERDAIKDEQVERECRAWRAAGVSIPRGAPSSSPG